jgi:pimeloyl-ACP methyl ester carboxylesterase
LALARMTSVEASTRRGQRAQAQDSFVTVNGVKLHYVDWGGHGETLLFLTGGGDTAHSFDALAPMFTDHFHVLGLTRRGQGPSDKPPSGYHTGTLAEDIRSFIDAMHIGRVTLVGYSIAGDEETRFAGLHPERVRRLVYLDAVYDRKSNWELTSKSPFPGTRFPDDLSAAIARGSRETSPDYSGVTAPALAVYAVPATFPLRPDVDPATRARADAFFLEFTAWIRQQMEQFRSEVKNGHVVELRNTTHGDILTNERTRTRIIRIMRRFLHAHN